MQVTNGVIKYGETRKIAEYESKTASVELSFTIAEDEDADHVTNAVGEMVHRHFENMIGAKLAGVSPAATTAKPAATKAPAKAPKIPATPAAEKPAAKPAADAASMVEEPEAPAATAKAEVQAPEDDGLGDLMGGAPAAATPITDKELTDSTQQCQAKNKNAPAIRKALNDCGVKHPPGRIIDLPQEKRQAYLDKLKEIKPLA